MEPKQPRKRRSDRRERRLQYRLLRRIYALCRSRQWRLQYAKMRHNVWASAHVGQELSSDGFLWNAVGCIDTTRHVIFVDYRFDVLSTFVHECLHILMEKRPEALTDDEEEREVQRLEGLVMRHMTPAQAKRLHTEMALLLHAQADDPDPDDFDD